MDTVRLGRITSPVGIKGELRVYPYTDTPARFSQIEKVLIDGRYVEIENVRYQKNMVILKLAGTDDRNLAEALRDKTLYLERSLLWEQPEDTYFTDDLIGMQVFDDEGNSVGILGSVVANPAHDLYEIKQENGSFLLPAVKEFILDVDIENKRMKVHLIEGICG